MSRVYSPCWPFTQRHLEDILDAAWKLSEDIGDSAPREVGWNVGQDGSEELLFIVRMMHVAYTDVLSATRKSSPKVKRDAVHALWWVLGIPFIVQERVRHNLLKEEEEPEYPLILKSIPIKFDKHESIWSQLRMRPKELLRLDRKDHEHAPYLTFTFCCHSVGLEVEPTRRFFISRMSDGPKSIIKSTD